jgi:hypothetical protein
MGINLTEISQKVTDVVSNAANVYRNFYDLHYNPTPKDVALEYVDENGVKRTVNVANRAKIASDFDAWKSNLKVHQIAYDYRFKKIIPEGVKLDGSVLWNPRDLDAENKSSYIILFDGANNESLKYGDGGISGGIYIGNILFSTAGKGGGVWPANVGFLYSHYGHTNNSLLEDLPIVRSSHAFNGAQVKVQARSLSTGNKYTQHNQILFYLNEGDRTATENIEVTLVLKRII